ncbi:MAG TPA: thioredoxin domain-containing protein [Kofleriaceae bacterium]|nr:thioredoxin domain-containing protein [Kofleriaceae bacterium]
MHKLASVLFLAAAIAGCEKHPSKLDSVKAGDMPKALQIDSAAAATADHSGTVEDRLTRLENELAKNREALEFLGKVYGQQKAQMEAQEAGQPATDATFAIPVANDVKIGMVEGPASAPITIVKAFDFACPFCMKANPTMKELVAEYQGKVRVVYKNLVVHPDTAMAGHLASCAAAKQGQYTKFKDAFWDKAFTPYAESRGQAADKMGKDNILAFSKEIGLDTTKLAADMDSEECKKLVQGDMSDLEPFRVTSTPVFFVNGRIILGALPKEAFKQLIDEELDKAEASGVAGADYYEKVVMAKGEKTFRSKKDPKPQ